MKKLKEFKEKNKIPEIKLLTQPVKNLKELVREKKMIADRNKHNYHNVYDSAKSAVVTPKSGSNYS